MARVPQDASLDVQVSIKELNDELREIKKALADAKASIPSTKAVEELQGAVVRLSKTPTYLDPNDVFRGSGPAHMHGYVPDPGPTPGTAKFLREDGAWQPASGGAPGPHTHASDEITHVGSGYVAANDVKEAIEELDSEKLARSGAQDMLGDLDMGGNAIGDVENLTFTGGVGAAIIDQARTIYMTGEGEIQGVKHIDMSVSGPGEGRIDNPHVISMAGAETDNEARIENVKALEFDEVTPFSKTYGRVALDSTESAPIVYANSGATVHPITWGNVAKLASVEYRLAKMAVIADGYWALDSASGGYVCYDGFSNGLTNFRADSDRTFGAIITWLTGKTSGANLLIAQTNPPPSTGQINFQNQFLAGLTRLGHTYTLTGAHNNFGAYEPLNFDALIWGYAWTVTSNYHGYISSADIADYYLANYGKLLTIGASNNLSRYGIDSSGPHQGDFSSTGHYVLGGYGPSNWRGQMAFDCAAFGDPGIGGSWGTNKYALALGTSSYLTTGTVGAPGGTRTIYNCVLDGQPSHTHQNGIIGLWEK